MLDDLTYLECEMLVARIETGDDVEAFAKLVTDEAANATISQPLAPKTNGDSADVAETWRDRLASEIQRIRIPQL
jgi:hypothetical protein